MKKRFGLYFAIWLVLLVLFNIISFFSRGGLENTDKYTASFWIGYIFITITFLGQLYCAYVAFKASSAQKLFYNISLLGTSYAGLISSFSIGGLCMAISFLPYWIGVVLCAIILAGNVISVVKASAAIEEVTRVDETVKAQTLFVKSLTVDAETLFSQAKTEEIKAECKRVYEAVRYSDPMSNTALVSLESQITIKFHALSDAVKGEDLTVVKAAADELMVLLSDRNKKCMLLK